MVITAGLLGALEPWLLLLPLAAVPPLICGRDIGRAFLRVA